MMTEYVSLRDMVKNKNKPRKACTCSKETRVIKGVDPFGWYECGTCNGYIDLRRMASELKDTV